jgi:ABC-type uncharacterized transport system ATPase subunit
VVVVDQGRAMFNGTVDEIKSKVDLRQVSFVYKKADIEFKNWPGVLSLSQKGARTILYTHDSDQLVRTLIEKKIAFQDLAIELSSLEEAFLHIRKSL